MGLVPPEPGFLASCARRGRSGALLVFDEVISGFRVAPGGAQERERVTPDLTVLGKMIGGGFRPPRMRGRGAHGAGGAGRRRVPGGHAVGEPAGHRRRTRDAEAAGRRGLPAIGTIAESWPRGSSRRRRTRASRRRPVVDRPAHGVLFRRPFKRYLGARRATWTPTPPFVARCSFGGLPPASQYEAWFPSLAHGEPFECTVAAAREALAEVAAR